MKIENFTSKIDKEKSEIFYNNEKCWEWTGHITKHGYGQFNFDGKMMQAHRVSYMLFNENFENSLLVLHHCDNKKCVNPNHLFLGNTQDNVKDKVSKGRQSRTSLKGEKNRSSKLKNKDIEEIRKMFSSGLFTKTEIAKKYNVTRVNIYWIINGKTWK